MPTKTIFISSTYRDLAEHRRSVWEALKQFDVTIRGMEEFGARTERPLDTCLAEVEQSDVYVGIIAFRLGSMDSSSRKSFTQLEYEHAVATGKEVLLYIADEDSGCVPYAHIDSDGRNRRRLEAFKNRLRERHTVDTFSTPEDLVEKLARNVARFFEPIQSPASVVPVTQQEFEKTIRVLRQFRLTPARFNGQQVRLGIGYNANSPFPAARSLCRQFNLEYGNTVGMYIAITNPAERELTAGFRHMFATGSRVDEFLALPRARGTEVYAALQFSAEDVNRNEAEFFGDSYPQYDEPEDPREVWVAPEGKVILLFSKAG
jgi:hypothetical protein